MFLSTLWITTYNYIVQFLLLFVLFWEFFNPALADGFSMSLSDKSSQVSRTLLSILAVLNNVVVWMVSTGPLNSKSSSLCTNNLVNVTRAAIKIGIIVTFMFHCLFNRLARPMYLFLFLLSFNFTLWSAETAKTKILYVPFSFLFFFLFIILRSSHLADVWWFVSISKSQWGLCVSFSRTVSWLCIYHLFIWSNFNFLHISQGITLPTQSCLDLYSFCSNLLHSLIMRLNVSSLSPHNLHLLFSTSYLFSLWYG